MKILIVEDERPAANNLIRELQKQLDEAEIIGPLESIAETKSWLKNHDSPDLIFLDINLTDGPSFEIFDGMAIDAPVIFCTAYDQYALKAFKLNSVDYLLKPLDPDDLKRALNKYRHWVGSDPSSNIQTILKELVNPIKTHKQRFVIKIGDQLRIVKLEEVSFFVSFGKDAFLQTNGGRQLPIDESLDRLESQLPGGEFFRINRNYLIRLEAISDMRSYSGTRLKLELHDCDDQDILVSRDKTSHFKKWLAGEA